MENRRSWAESPAEIEDRSAIGSIECGMSARRTEPGPGLLVPILWGSRIRCVGRNRLIPRIAWRGADSMGGRPISPPVGARPSGTTGGTPRRPPSGSPTPRALRLCERGVLALNPHFKNEMTCIPFTSSIRKSMTTHSPGAPTGLGPKRLQVSDVDAILRRSKRRWFHSTSSSPESRRDWVTVRHQE